MNPPPTSLSLLLGLTALLCLAPARAATVLHAGVDHEQGRYAVAFEVLLDADMRRVRRYLTDYDHLDRLSETITESRLLRTEGGGRYRIRITLRPCVLFFCKTLRKVQELRHEGGSDILSRIDPAESDFTHAREHWRITPEGGRTRVRYDAELVPGFFVPPLIGPLILKMKIRRELEVTAGRLEQLSAHE